MNPYSDWKEWVIGAGVAALLLAVAIGVSLLLNGGR